MHTCSSTIIYKKSRMLVHILFTTQLILFWAMYLKKSVTMYLGGSMKKNSTDFKHISQPTHCNRSTLHCMVSFNLVQLHAWKINDTVHVFRNGTSICHTINCTHNFINKVYTVSIIKNVIKQLHHRVIMVTQSAYYTNC